MLARQVVCIKLRELTDSTLFVNWRVSVRSVANVVAIIECCDSGVILEGAWSALRSVASSTGKACTVTQQ
jgi:hypothetical protein